MLCLSLSYSGSVPAIFRFSKYEWSLIFITMLWGGTFLVVHTAMQYAGPLFFVGMRFGLASLFVLPFVIRKMRGVTRTEIIGGFTVGISIFFTYTLQSFGLTHISSSMSAFITAFYVPLVPLMQWLFLRRRPGRMSMIGIALAFFGLMLVSGPEASGLQVGIGEIATLLGAVSAAAEIILIARFTEHVDTGRFTFLQLAFASLICFLFMPAAGETIPQFHWGWVIPVVSMALVSTLVQFAMTWAQRYISPTRATVIYAAEPVWAGILGALVGEQLPLLAIIGASFIVAGVLVSELKLPRKTPVDTTAGDRAERESEVLTC